MGLRAGKYGPWQWPCGMGAVPCPWVIPPPALDQLIRVEGLTLHSQDRPPASGRERP